MPLEYSYKNHAPHFKLAILSLAILIKDQLFPKSGINPPDGKSLGKRISISRKAFSPPFISTP
jgi:hypothetical protein